MNGLYMTYVQVASNKPTGIYTMGALSDSYYEYLLKAWIQGGKKDKVRCDCEFKWIWIPVNMNSSECECVNVWMCECANVWMCECVNVWMCECDCEF